MDSAANYDEEMSEEISLISGCKVMQSSTGKLKNMVREWLGLISVPVYILVMLFAISSWVDINGLWVELPLLVNSLPEGWSLPSYLAIIIQVANIGPITYTIANRLAPNHVKEWPVIYVIIIAGATACLLLGFFWKTTSFIGGVERSTTLIALAGLLALVDCTSSVVFLPYMAMFKPQYMTALYIGEGLSGLIPGLVGLVQSVDSDPACVNKTVLVQNITTGLNYTEWLIVPVYPNPVFSIEVFFFFLFAMLIISGVAFSLLQWLPYCRHERTQVTLFHVASSHVHYNKASVGTDGSASPANSTHHHHNSVSSEQNGYLEVVHTSTEPLHTKLTPPRGESPTENRDDDGRDPRLPRMSTFKFVLLLVLTAWLNSLTNGILASTQSYSTLPYGSLVYSIAVRLSTVANPLACVLALFVVCHSVSLVVVLTTVGSVLAGYQVYLAAASPNPPLVGTALGDFIAVTTAVLMTGIFSYAKVSIASILRTEGRRALLICGAVIQTGSFVGAFVAFILVNTLNLFTSIPPCSL